MNLLFVNHNGFDSNSAVHISSLADRLVVLGIDVAVAVPDQEDLHSRKDCIYTRLSYSMAVDHRFRDGRGADLVHAWTPRQGVSRCVRRLADAHGCSFAVHLEDNEHAITAAYLGLSVDDMLTKVRRNPRLIIPEYLSHPEDMRDLLHQAAGVTVLIDRLLEFVPKHVPSRVFWPAAENSLFSPRLADVQLSMELGLDPEAKIIVYHGNVHAANVSEVRSLYLAVGALVRRGVNVVLIRLGKDYVPLLDESVADIACHVIHAVFQPREKLPRYLSLADVFVQPGRVDEFNAFRFPSKLPEFFAMGRPVLLPATNIGCHVSDGVDALLLEHGDAIDIATKVEKVFVDETLRRRLAAGAYEFYRRSMSWDLAAESLLTFYEAIGRKRRLTN